MPLKNYSPHDDDYIDDDALMLHSQENTSKFTVTDVPLQLLGERVLRRSGGLGMRASPEVLLGGEAHRHDGVPVVLTQQPEQPRARPDALHFPLLMFVCRRGGAGRLGLPIAQCRCNAIRSCSWPTRNCVFPRRQQKFLAQVVWYRS